MEKRQYRIDQPTSIAPTSNLERTSYRKILAISSPKTFSVDLALPVIAENPVIAQRLLRFVNSSSRISRRRITDLRHAITILGARGIREFSMPVVESLDSKGESPRDQSSHVSKPESESFTN